MLTIYETEYGNFSSPRDLLRYMIEENIKTVHLTAKLCGAQVGGKDKEMTLADVEKWVAMGEGGRVICQG